MGTAAVPPGALPCSLLPATDVGWVCSGKPPPPALLTATDAGLPGCAAGAPGGRRRLPPCHVACPPQRLG